MKLELVHVDTCLSCFWGGHHQAHLQIPVWRNMRLKDIKSALRDEVRQGAIMGSDRLAYLLSADMVRPEDEKEADRAVRAAYAAINRVSGARKGQRVFFSDLDDPEGMVCAYFVFVEMD